MFLSLKNYPFFLCMFFLFSCSVQKNTATKTESFSGKQLTFARNKGNCLACHAIEDGEFPGNIGPPLKAIQKRFKNKQLLRQQIWDPTLFNPETSMPPFGKNKILTEREIDRIVDYIWRL
jgi:sulfur-oxidizing protein SoxX